MFGFHGPLLRTAPLLVTAATVTGTGAVTFGAMTAAGVGNVPVVATGAITLGTMTSTGGAGSTATVTGVGYPGGMLGHGLLPRKLINRYAIRQSLLKYRP